MSIVIPAYNSAATIVDTVRSALGQQSVDPEVIVVDDGSVDDTMGALASEGLLDQIRYLRQDNAGVSVARNRGLDLCSGRYVCFLDSDDILLPTHAVELIHALGRRGLRVGYCDYEYVDESRSRRLPIAYPHHEGDCAGKILSENFIPTPAVLLLSRSSIGDLRFEPAMRNCQDWFFWANLLLKETICFHPAVLVQITHRPHSLSRGRDKMNRAALAVMTATQRLIEDNPGRFSSRDLSQYYYRFASCLLWEGEFRGARRAWRQASKHGLPVGRHGALAAKAALRLANLHRKVESLLWNRKLRRPTQA